MKLKGSAEFSASPEKVWAALLDPEVMARCIPGCQKLEEVGRDSYNAILKVGIGAVSGTYQGKLSISDKVAAERYSMIFEGAGSQGFVKGSGNAILQGENGVTRVDYTCDIQIGGLIASVGQRVLEGVSSFLVGQMMARLRTVIAEG